MFVDRVSQMKRRSEASRRCLHEGGRQSLTSSLIVATFLTLYAAGAGLAQNTNSGDIRGTVIDASGAVVPGAIVTLLNTDTGVVKELVTNSAGLYDAVSILPGNYTITFLKRALRRPSAAASRCR